MGAVYAVGDPDAAARLREAMTVPPLPETVAPEDLPVFEGALHVHLFHSFAARMHPLTARHLVRDLGPGDAVLDPFVGSGTVLVEAAQRGAAGSGLDVGELQVRLSRFKATPVPAGMRGALLQRAREVAQAAEERVRQRRRPERRPNVTFDEPAGYEPHVYLELCGLRLEIAAVQAADAPLGEALALAFSSLVLKALRPPSGRTLGKLQVTRWFLRRAEELVRLQEFYAARVPPGTPSPRLLRGDARRDLPRLAAPGSVRRVLTSPPYLGVYDYAAHHARRCAWLGIPVEDAARDELGARHRAADAPLGDLIAAHRRDSEAWLRAVAEALRADGDALVLVGDSQVQGTRLSGDEPLRAAAGRAGLRLLAACTVERPSAPRGPGRAFEGPPLREHLLHFVR